MRTLGEPDHGRGRWKMSANWNLAKTGLCGNRLKGSRYRRRESDKRRGKCSKGGGDDEK